MTRRRILTAVFGLLLGSGLLLALSNCERPVPNQDCTTSTPSATRDDQQDIGAATNPELLTPSPVTNAEPLHDWVAAPLVDPTEQDLPAPKIVSAAPNVTEICCALGLRGALTGRTRYCDYPPGIETVTSIGALIDVNVEALLSLRPDLIIVAGTSRAQIDRLTSLNLRVESVPDFTTDNLYTAIRRIGELTMRPNTAETLCANIHADLRLIDEKYGRLPRRRVLVCTAPLAAPPRPPLVAGPGSFYDDLLRRAGLENVAPRTQTPFAPLSLEYIIRADPDVIIELVPDESQRPGGHAEAARAWSKLGNLKAVADRRVYVLIGNRYFLLGPRLAITYDAICRCVSGTNDGKP